jgi:hypothetical protein
LECANLNGSVVVVVVVVVELLFWILVIADCQKLGGVRLRLRWSAAAKGLLRHQ